MKKALLITSVFLFSAICLFAGGLNFDASPDGSLWTENIADPYNFVDSLKVLYLPNEEERNIKILTYYGDIDASSVYSAEIPRFPEGSEPRSLYLSGKLTVDESLLNLSFEPDNFPAVCAQLNIKAGLSLNFEATGGMKSVSYDGTFFLGAEMAIGGASVLRAGIHHFSGHYGDEVMEKFFEYNDVKHAFAQENAGITIDGSEYLYYGLAQYVRDNSFLIGYQQKLPWGFTLYAEYSQPLAESFIRPFFECPPEHETSTLSPEDYNVWGDLAGGEGVWSLRYNESARMQAESVMDTFDSSYKAARVHGGVIWTKSFGSFALNAGADIQAHQDGKTLHRIGGYDKDNPWEFEYAVSAGILLESVGITIEYRSGRFPALNLFNNRVKTVSLVFTLN